MTETDPFSGIIGHEPAVTMLRRLLEWQSFSQALCFTGPQAIGKRTVAEAFTRALLGASNLSTHPDFHVLRREPDEKTGELRKEISIDQVRALRSALQLSSFMNSWNVALVDDADALSPGAANAFLKTLEEPAARAVIILIVASPEALPATVRSRCQAFRFRLVPDGSIARGLEERGITRREARRYAEAAAGRPGVAVSLATDPVSREAWQELLARGASLLTGPLYRRLNEVPRVLGERLSPVEQAAGLERALRVWSDALRQSLAVCLGLREALEDAPEYITVAQRLGPQRVAAGLLRVSELRHLLRKNCNPRLCLEQFVLSFV